MHETRNLVTNQNTKAFLSVFAAQYTELYSLQCIVKIMYNIFFPDSFILLNYLDPTVEKGEKGVFFRKTGALMHSKARSGMSSQLYLRIKLLFSCLLKC